MATKITLQYSIQLDEFLYSFATPGVKGFIRELFKTPHGKKETRKWVRTLLAKIKKIDEWYQKNEIWYEDSECLEEWLDIIDHFDRIKDPILDLKCSILSELCRAIIRKERLTFIMDYLDQASIDYGG